MPPILSGDDTMSRRIAAAAHFWYLLALLSFAGWAQEPGGDPETPPDDAPVIVDEIEVTAQRTEEALQEVPISIATLSGEEIEDQGIANVQALADAAPGVVVSGHGTATGEIAVFIRGVGSNTMGLGTESTVGFYVDGVYMPRPQSFLRSFLDLERAEVLRGPQGTLWGRNSTGGAIHLVTRAPEPNFSGGLFVSASEFASAASANGTRYGLVLTGPMTKRLWGRVSVAGARIDDATWNQHLEAVNRNLDGLSGRGALTWLPNDTMTLTLRADATEDDSHYNFALKPGDVSPKSLIGTLSRFYGLSTPSDVHRVASGEHPLSAFSERGVSLHLDKTVLGGWLDLTSISSARRFSSNRRADLDGTALPFADVAGSFDSDWWSQEVHMKGLKDRTRFIFGLYGFGENGRHLTDVRADLAILLSSLIATNARSFGLDPETFCSLGAPTLCGPAFYEVLAPSLGLPLPGTLRTTNLFHTRLDSSSYAAYGQVDLALTDRLTFTTGLRYTKDDKDHDLATLERLAEDAPPETIPGTATESRTDSWRGVTPKLGLEFRPRTGLLLYAAASTGYKSGGFNAVSFQPSFGPEIVRSYEFGFKASSRRDVTLNASAFRYDYDDMQVEVLQIDRSFVENAANALVRGIDLDLRLRPNPRLGIDLSMEFLDDEFEQFGSLDPAAIAEFVNEGLLGFTTRLLGARSFDEFDQIVEYLRRLEEAASRRVALGGNSLTRAPDLSAKASVAYTFDLGERGSLTARGEFQYTDDLTFDPFQRFVQPAYSLLHANLNWSPGRNGLSLNLYGRNLTDEEYRLTEFYTNYADSFRLWAPPREIGLQLRFDF